jgi:hypothetical protein
MDDDKLRKALGLDWQDKLMQPHKKIQEMSTAMNKIMETENRMKAVFGSHNANSFFNSNNVPKSAIDAVLSSSTFSAFNLASEKIKQQNYIRDVVLGGSTVFNVAKALNETSNAVKNLYDFSVIANDIQSKFSTYNSIFERQLSISEVLAKDYFHANKLSTPDWVTKFSQTVSDFDKSRITAFDILTADTYTRITENLPVNEDEEVKSSEEKLDEIALILKENKDVKEELENLYISFAKHIANKLKRRNKRKLKSKDLKAPSEQLALFIHKNLFENSKISTQTVYTFICLIDYVFNTIILAIVFEATGTKIFEKVFGEDTPPTQIQIAYQPKIVKNVYANVIHDFTIDAAPLYQRNSTKTKCIGKIKPNTQVLILNQKPKWCLVEVLIEKFDKKTKTTIDKVVRGWVMKTHLDYFQ